VAKDSIAERALWNISASSTRGPEKNPRHRPGGRDSADPEWFELRQTSSASVLDPLRGDPRFEKIVASLAPKSTNK
jgi:hypothetical protein